MSAKLNEGKKGKNTGTPFGDIRQERILKILIKKLEWTSRSKGELRVTVHKDEGTPLWSDKHWSLYG